MIYCERFVSYRSTPDHSHPSLRTAQALQFTILNRRVIGSHSLRIKTQNIDDINRSLVNTSVEFYVSGSVPPRKDPVRRWALMNENLGIE